jgi:hypothetical protein
MREALGTSRAVWLFASVVLLSVAFTAAGEAMLSSPADVVNSTCFYASTQFTPTLDARLLLVALSSSQYETFARANGVPSLVLGGPAMEVGQDPGCQGAVVTAFAYNFVAGGEQIAIGVSPVTGTVVATVTVPALKFAG